MSNDMEAFLPGFDAEQFIGQPESEDFFAEDEAGKSYFDAATLADAPGYQRNANANQTYVIHLVFPSKDELVRGIAALTQGQRKSVSPATKEARINAVALRKDERTWLEWWEQTLGGKVPAVSLDTPATPGEGLGGIPVPPVARPKKPKARPAPKEKPAEIPVIADYRPGDVHASDVLVAFPTYKRSSDVKTWSHFPAGLAHGFVEPQELHLYSAFNDGQNLQVYPTNGMSISQKRRYIVNWAIENGYNWLFMLEDDLTGFYIRDGKTDGGSDKLVKSDYKKVMGDMLGFAEENSVTLLGLSQQQSNHYYEERLVKYSCKITEFCLLNLVDLKASGINYREDIAHFEDFDITVQILLSGFKAGLYTPAAFGHVTMASNKGGGFMFDGMEKRKALAEEAISQMIGYYSDNIVTRREGRLFPEPKVNWSELYTRIRRPNDPSFTIS